MFNPQINYGPSLRPQTILNCLVLGNGTDRVFSVKIPLTDNVAILKDLIKDETKPMFHNIDANTLKLWKVDINLEEKEQIDLPDDAKELKPFIPLSKVFAVAPKDEHLHIIVQVPPAAFTVPPHSHPSINLNCFILGHDLYLGEIFQIEIAPTETVIVLRDLIKDKNRDVFRDIPARRLCLWNVSLPIDDTLECSLNTLRLDPKECLSPATQMFKVFENPLPKHLHIVIQHPSTTAITLPIDRALPVDHRFANFMKDIDTASAAAGPTTFAATQRKKAYLCNRPREAADPVPVILLDRILAEFVDDCQNRQPTGDDDSFVLRLSEKMCSFHDDEPSRMLAFRELLSDYGIKLNASTVGSTKSTTDGHLFSSKQDIVMVISEGKNEIGIGGAEPFAQALLHYHKFIYSRKYEILPLRSLFPCLNVIFFGACIGFVGSVVTDRVQADVLVPIIPLFWHLTDLPMQAMAARAFGALKIAIEKLDELYSNPIAPLEPQDSPFLSCPYPRSYTDWTDHIHAFSYDVTQPLREQLIFFGETSNGAAQRKICIKFVRHYSPEAHKFCASKGHAPELIAYNHLPGGWNMVVMDVLDIDHGDYPQQSGSYRQLSEIVFLYTHKLCDINAHVVDYQLLERSITSLVKGLHNHEGGYVHGDLRDTNFFVRDDGKHFVLLDFDSAGPIHKTHYPMHVNRQGIRRPEGARDWKEIMAQHDLDMLKYIFHPELGDLEENTQEGPAEKRPRAMSPSIGSSIAMDV